ncbi:YeeE/YedE family protein [Halegenticoccus tardaugens]|uniref:YeeE/YedE family protein n=1 Tax=Halegenticoccus tardaugens TaxID=2071624 RepID=UPI00100BE7B1|nr:YeeE/YedE family protein [Halegenticoccus tardaugens]
MTSDPLSAVATVASIVAPLAGPAPASFGEAFPNGVSHYAVGGVLVGIGVATIYLGTGIIAGASTFLESTLSYVSSVDRFNRPRYVASRDWRVVFTVGIVAGAALYAALFQEGFWTTDVQWWRLFVGGTLVGVGTRLGKGCTSGHGVCGVGSGSPTSIANVLTFMAVAVGTAQFVAALGVTP